MSAGRLKPFSRRAVLRLHVPLVLGVTVCLYAGWFELTRARAGHTIAWVYVVEWPMFALAGIAIWWRVLTERDTPGARSSRQDRTPPASRHHIPDDDPDLLAWRRYRDRVEQETGTSDQAG